MDAERQRIQGFGQLENGLHQASDWYLWGPYVTERQWGTVREDYSEDGAAWDYFPHDHARSRAYRWGEDGLAGFCDIEQRLCLGLALWNGRDAILKERLFGLTGPQGNHGEDVKEYWWYLDAVPSHAWNRWRYHYPQGPFPYNDLVATNAARNRFQPEYELLDTGAFDGDRYWIVEVCYAKDGPGDVLMNVSVKNAGPDAETLHVLPTAWFRNTWSWDAGAPKPVLEAAGDAAVRVAHPFLGELELIGGDGPDGSSPAVLFCENETNLARLYNAAPTTPYPKDGINDHVISGAPTVNPDRQGTKCSFWYRLTLAPGATAELRLRLRPPARQPGDDGPLLGQFVQILDQRRAEADEFYAGLTPAGASADEAMVMRQAFAGLLWSKQFYYFEVTRWLDGDPTQPPPPPGRRLGRNIRWGNFDAFDIMSMPDKWEYPWFAAWDLGFHCVALAHLDPAFAKYQIVLLCREWFQNPNGALPAYEWDFGDVNPPVQAWAALEVFAIDQGRDFDFLSRLFDKLLINFTWWVNREDADGSNVFQGGFLGLDNIGPIDRSHLPGRRHPGAVRRHRLDGLLRDQHGPHRDRAAAVRPPPGQRHRAQVPRAFRGHRRRDQRPGHVGRKRRPLLRQAAHRGRHRHPDEGPVHGRRHPGAGRGGRRPGDARRLAAAGQAVRGLPAPGGHRRRGHARQAGHDARQNRRPAAAAQPGRPRPAGKARGVPVRRERVPVPVRATGPVGLPSRPSLRAGRGRPDVHGRLRAGRVHHGDVRRQLQLARPAVVPAQLPADQRAGPVPPVLRRRSDAGVPDRVREAAHPRRHHHRPAGPAHLDFPRRRGRAAALLRLGRAAAAGSGVER